MYKEKLIEASIFDETNEDYSRPLPALDVIPQCSLPQPPHKPTLHIPFPMQFALSFDETDRKR